MIGTQINSLPFIFSRKEISFSILQILGASFFLALCAQITIPLYFTPIPLTGQTFGIMFIGATMGSRKGVLSVLAYLAEGALGFPVFLSLLGPTGGYHCGFILQVYLVGRFIERQASFHGAKTLSILLLSCVLQLGLGVLWLSNIVGFEKALMFGLYPFIIGEIIKAFCVTTYLSAREKNFNLSR